MDVEEIRRDYRGEGLDPSTLGPDPLVAFDRWLASHAEVAGVDANAMVLSTVDPATLRPSARTVLLRRFDGGEFVFYTNLGSRKSRELLANAQATLLFSWVIESRQVTVEGTVQQVSTEASDAYFESRPRKSQLGAWASDQSAPIDDRTVLETALEAAEQRFDGGRVERPPHWGGFVLRPDRYEFWQGQPSRLHDRVEFRMIDGAWVAQRLAP